MIQYCLQSSKLQAPTLVAFFMEYSKSLQIKHLLLQLDWFVNRNLMPSCGADLHEIVDVRVTTPKRILQLSHRHRIYVPAALNACDWAAFCAKIIENKEDDVPMANGIFTLVREIARACMPTGSCEFQLCSTEPPEDGKRIVQTPNISFNLQSMLRQRNDDICALGVPIVISTEPGNLYSAVLKSLALAVSRIRRQVHAVDPFRPDLHSYCIGCDGRKIVIGFAQVKNVCLEVCITSDCGIELWNHNGTPPSTETEGVRLLRALFCASAADLGMAPARLTIAPNIQLQGLLGRGSFCSTYVACKVDCIDNTDSGEFVLKIPSLVVALGLEPVGAATVAHMQREWHVLRELSQLPDTPGLPRLLDATATTVVNTTTSLPLIMMLPVGVPLISHICHLRRPNRVQFAANMKEDITAALAAALSKGFCHTDIRPDNIVVAPPERCILVDWGVALAPGAPMQDCTGCLAFLHDDLVMHLFHKEDADTDDEPPPAPAFLSHYDLASLDYTVHVVAAGYEELHPPWAGCIGQTMIARRDCAIRTL